MVNVGMHAYTVMSEKKFEISGIQKACVAQMARQKQDLTNLTQKLLTDRGEVPTAGAVGLKAYAAARGGRGLDVVLVRRLRQDDPIPSRRRHSPIDRGREREAAGA
jgi:hypothetical protein